MRCRPAAFKTAANIAHAGVGAIWLAVPPALLAPIVVEPISGGVAVVDPQPPRGRRSYRLDA
ncbi:MAG TPA: hypothetical protein VLD13_13660 [Gaiellaceae bacterium]|nr:hypothetical protein [Gaiellaceae bacterium]